MNQDQKVSASEIDEIFANLKGEKEFRIYEKAGHGGYLEGYEEEWVNDVGQFINTLDLAGVPSVKPIVESIHNHPTK